MRFLFIFFMTCWILGCTSYGPLIATSNSIPRENLKVGTACSSWLIYPKSHLEWGRNDIMEAAKQAQIEKISVVDTESISYLLYGKVCTLVYGQ